MIWSEDSEKLLHPNEAPPNHGAKLRQVSAPVEVKESGECEREPEEHQKLMLDANNEEWEEAIRQFTFTTHYLPLERLDAAALLVANLKRGLAAGSIVQEDLESLLPGQDLEMMQMDASGQLQDLNERLSRHLKTIQTSEGAGFFIKTSCRSPKDAPAASQNLKELYQQRLMTSDDPNDFNSKLDALLYAGVQCLKVTEAHQAIELLCSSDRIRMDMFVALNPNLKDRAWQQNLVIREWTDIEPDMEFRGFVSNRQFTALSQYNHQMVSQRLLKQREEISQRIYKFWEDHIDPQLAPNEKLQSYIVDFALTGPNFDKVWVVELNPFLPSTSPNLFSWSRDAELLHNGPFTFRLREKSSRGVLADMEPEWKAILDL